jgi:hypothetical protein
MGIKCPTVDEGEIYCIREIDFLSRKPGDYIKLGKTERSTATRLTEHQTGNPRQEHDEFSLRTEMMSSLEKYLHYYFAEYCVNSEWFKMDETKVKTDVKALIEKLAKEHATVRPHFDEWKKQGKTVSNGKTIKANKVHKDLQKKYLNAWKKFKVAEGRMELAKLELKMLIGKSDGIEFMVYLVRTDKIDFEKAAFLKTIAGHKDKDKCYKTETKIGPQMPKVVGEESLGKIDSALNKKILDLEKNYKAVKPDRNVNFKNKPAKQTSAMKKKHQDVVKSKKAFKKAEWELQKLMAELVSHLKDNDAIDDVIKWERKQTTAPKFERSLAEKHFPTEYGAHCGAPYIDIHRVKIDDGVKYKP